MNNEELLENLVRKAVKVGRERQLKPNFGLAGWDAEEALREARAAVLARMAGPGEVVVPTRPDKGPFEWCGDDGDFIVSRDFIYDAGLKLSGDFPDDETKRAYMQRVMDILNAARPNQGGNDDQAG